MCKFAVQNLPLKLFELNAPNVLSLLGYLRAHNLDTDRVFERKLATVTGFGANTEKTEFKEAGRLTRLQQEIVMRFPFDQDVAPEQQDEMGMPKATGFQAMKLHPFMAFDLNYLWRYKFEGIDIREKGATERIKAIKESDSWVNSAKNQGG